MLVKVSCPLCNVALPYFKGVEIWRLDNLAASQSKQSGDRHDSKTASVCSGLLAGCSRCRIYFRAHRARNRHQGFAVADYHYQIDLGLEAPAFMVALVTGLLLIDPSRLDGLYLVKVLAGGLAVLSNLVCLWPVIQRKRAADSNDRGDSLTHHAGNSSGAVGFRTGMFGQL